jgi:fidgetin-like protein 1
MFNIAKKKQPSVIFIDEVDSILSSRGEGEHEASRRLKTEFLVQMDGVRNINEDRIIVIGATNRPQELDEAVIRRFPKRIYIDLPDVRTRESLIVHQLSKVFNNLTSEDVNTVVQTTEFYSGSDLAAVCKEAAMEPLRRVSKEQLQKGYVPEVTLNSFLQALNVIRPSVSAQSLRFYHDWNSEFGSK